MICDRFSDSTLVYQGIAGDLGLDVIDRLQAPMIRRRGRARCHFSAGSAGTTRSAACEKRGGAARFEKKDADFHRDVRDGFLALAAETPDRIVVVEAEDTFDAVWAQIEAEMKQRFKL